MWRAKLDLNSIHTLNLFSRITRVRTKYCFNYNNWLIFVVPPQLIPKAVGEKGDNVRQMSNILKCRVKIIPSSSLEPFVKSVVYPVKFKKLTNENGDVIIFSNPDSKASLIGRNKARVNELAGILKQYFDIKTIKIV